MKSWHYALIAVVVIGGGAAFYFFHKKQAAAAVASAKPPASGVTQTSPSFLQTLGTDALGFAVSEGKKAFDKKFLS